MTNSWKGTGYFGHNLNHCQQVTPANLCTVIHCANFHVLFWHAIQLKQHTHTDISHLCVCLHVYSVKYYNISQNL